jgi:hypothetical protein
MPHVVIASACCSPPPLPPSSQLSTWAGVSYVRLNQPATSQDAYTRSLAPQSDLTVRCTQLSGREVHKTAHDRLKGLPCDGSLLKCTCLEWHIVTWGCVDDAEYASACAHSAMSLASRAVSSVRQCRLAHCLARTARGIINHDAALLRASCSSPSCSIHSCLILPLTGR